MILETKVDMAMLKRLMRGAERMTRTNLIIAIGNDIGVAYDEAALLLNDWEDVHNGEWACTAADSYILIQPASESG